MATVDEAGIVTSRKAREWVTWMSNGKEKVGEIIVVVPADTDVEPFLKDIGVPHTGVNKVAGQRSKESYLVSVSQGDGKKPVLYWPPPNLLRSAERPHQEPTPAEPTLGVGKAIPSEPKIPAAEKQRALTDYEKQLQRVLALKSMTDCEEWQRVHRWVKTQIQKHASEILDAEKSREVVQHQEGVKILRDILETVKSPVAEFQAFCNGMNLFASQFRTRATWNDDLGIVQLTEV